MDRKKNESLVPFARRLRKQMTKEERHLWYDYLRQYPVRFYRQKILGKYIADFYCAKAGLIVELDGSQHFKENQKEKDEKRTEYLQKYQIAVLRIPNNEVFSNFEGICTYIDEMVQQRLRNDNPSASRSSAPPLTQGRQ